VSEREAGVVIVVWRRSPEIEVLVLHRSHFGGEFEGDWAWTTPGGGRETGEHPQDAAQRELKEETGLMLACEAVSSAIALTQRDIEVSVFAVEAPTDAQIMLSDEHDRFEWVHPNELTRCLPAWVHTMYMEALSDLELAQMTRLHP
jgi:8-oxo-dGTP pyrophosphatase MutT (NUDIX family)